MPKKANQNEEAEVEKVLPVSNVEDSDTVENLTRMLAAVLSYLSDDENEVIDIEYIFDNTQGLRDWWAKYKERNRKLIEEEIKESLGDLSIEELQRIRKQIKENLN